MGLILFLLFLGLPLIEIALFIQVGGAIGTGTTILVVILTAIMGSFLLRTQGLVTMNQARQSMDKGELPVDSVIHGFFLVIAGAFLLTPGFLTDAIGFALFVPGFRLALGRSVMRWFMARGTIHVHTADGGWTRRDEDTPATGPVIDGETFDEDKEPDSPSPWQR